MITYIIYKNYKKTQKRKVLTKRIRISSSKMISLQHCTVRKFSSKDPSYKEMYNLNTLLLNFLEHKEYNFLIPLHVKFFKYNPTAYFSLVEDIFKDPSTSLEEKQVSLESLNSGFKFQKDKRLFTFNAF